MLTGDVERALGELADADNAGAVAALACLEIDSQAQAVFVDTRRALPTAPEGVELKQRFTPSGVTAPVVRQKRRRSRKESHQS